MKIKEVKARKIFDSNGRDAIEVEVVSDINTGRGSIGYGTSIGGYEVRAYPDDIKKLINLVNNVFSKDLKNIQVSNFEDLEKIERYLSGHDYSEKLEKIGGNVIVALELAILKSCSTEPLYKFLNDKKVKMPMPLGNCIGGGSHSLNIKNPDFQEYLVLPRVKKFEEAAEINIEVYNKVKEELKKLDKNFNGTRNIEGAWSTTLSDAETLPLLRKVVERISKERSSEIRIGVDVAADKLWNGRRYEYKNFSKVQQKRNLSRDEQIQFIDKIIKNNELYYIEDPLYEDDFDGFQKLIRSDCLICGDDLIATNPKRLEEAKGKISAVIIKPNQVGSLIKTKEVVELAKKLKITPVISHRSGETEDNSIAHLAVAWECPIIKTGIVNGERINKINELLRINENI